MFEQSNRPGTHWRFVQEQVPDAPPSPRRPALFWIGAGVVVILLAPFVALVLVLGLAVGTCLAVGWIVNTESLPQSSKGLLLLVLTGGLALVAYGLWGAL